MLARGDVIEGRYRVERLVGEGGMGAVYAVRDGSGAGYALKVLLDASDETLRKRFVREGEAAAALSSEHATRVYGSGTLASGAPYLLMELLEGEDLWDVVHEGGPLPAPQAVDYILQAGEALSEAHRLGMVHRDIKPANLFLATRPDGTRCVKLLDFGISKTALNTVAPMTQLTQTGSVLGSPEYMSPEQLVSSSDVDARADLWSIGATLHELLSATQAFAGETLAEIVTSIMRDPPRPLREVRPDLSPELEAVVRRCLEKDPELRFGSMEELASALRRAVPTRFEAAPTLVGHAPLPAPSAFETSPTLAPSPARVGSLAHAETLAHGSHATAAAGALRPDTRGAQAPTLPGTAAPPWASADAGRSTRAPTVASAPSPVAAARARGRWPLMVAALVGASLVGGLAVLAVIRGHGDDEQARSEEDDDRSSEDDEAASRAPDGDRTLPKAKRLALLAAVGRAEKKAGDGELDAADEAAERVVAAIEAAGLRPGMGRSPIASRAELVRAEVRRARSLKQARSYDGTQDLTAYLQAVATENTKHQTHAAAAYLWDGLSKSCPLAAVTRLYAELSRELMVKAQSAPASARTALHVHAASYASVGRGLIPSSRQQSQPARCVAKLAALDESLKALEDAAKARSGLDAPAPAPVRPSPSPRPARRLHGPNGDVDGF